LKTVGILLISLFVAFPSAFAAPTSQEQSLYDNLRSEFEKLDVQTRDVGDVLKSFDEPITISFPCDTGDVHTMVTSTITTSLAKFDSSLTHNEGAITGGIYVWKCSITVSGGQMTMNCQNELMLNSAAILASTEKDPRIKQVEDLVIFYHEMLHGQLMIDAIKSSGSWRDNACNKQPQNDLDYSYTDADHVVITPLQTDFADRLITKNGGIMNVEQIEPADTSSGSFSKKIGSLYDYPDYVKSGINVSARSYNIADIQITSQKTDIVMSGTLSNKTQPGIVWLYVFGKEQEEKPVPQSMPDDPVHVPSWIRSNAKWWSEGTISDSDFISGIQYLIQHGIMIIPQTSQEGYISDSVPHWVKSNAKWWSEGTISDSDFISGIQYLIQHGIMSVGQSGNASSAGPDDITDAQPEPAHVQSSVRVDVDVVEKKAYGSSQIQITGKIDDFKSGTSVILTIVRPDGTSFDLKGIVTNRGLFTVPLMIDGSSQTGKYAVHATYNNYNIGTTSFTVK